MIVIRIDKKQDNNTFQQRSNCRPCATRCTIISKSSKTGRISFLKIQNVLVISCT